MILSNSFFVSYVCVIHIFECLKFSSYSGCIKLTVCYQTEYNCYTDYFLLCSTMKSLQGSTSDLNRFNFVPNTKRYLQSIVCRFDTFK